MKGGGVEGSQDRSEEGGLHFVGEIGVIPRGGLAQSLGGGAGRGQVSLCGPGTQASEGFAWGS